MKPSVYWPKWIRQVHIAADDLRHSDADVGDIWTSYASRALLEVCVSIRGPARENVYLNAAILGLTRRETDERDSIAAFADIGSFIDQPVKDIPAAASGWRLQSPSMQRAGPVDRRRGPCGVTPDFNINARRIKDIPERWRGGAVCQPRCEFSVRTLCQRAVWLDRVLCA